MSCGHAWVSACGNPQWSSQGLILLLEDPSFARCLRCTEAGLSVGLRTLSNQVKPGVP